MADSIPDKSYFRIGEVSKILGVAPHVIRYWESEFKSIRPIRTKSDQRLYRKKDVEELITVRSLLYDQKFTISGAKKRLLEIMVQSAAAGHEREILSAIKKGLQEIKDKLTN
ncbi:MAG TPA: MerR family transcriptional regulator [Syntrophales bacterium]|nr:MerR family transcriptional regulator [Syntrophales bacterium]